MNRVIAVRFDERDQTLARDNAGELCSQQRFEVAGTLLAWQHGRSVDAARDLCHLTT